MDCTYALFDNMLLSEVIQSQVIVITIISTKNTSEQLSDSNGSKWIFVVNILLLDKVK